MKAFIASLLVLSSISAYANTLETNVTDALRNQAGGPITGEEALNVKRAIVDSIKNKNLECVTKVLTGTAPSNAEIKNQIISIVNNTTTTVSVDDNQTQPAITLFTSWSADDVTTTQFTTSLDFKTITSITANRETLKQTEQNTGTILNPRYETVTERISKVKATCSVK